MITAHRFFIDYEKEEKWLDAQSQKGLHLKKAIPFYYQFEEGVPEKYTYRLVLLPKDRKEYLEFLASTGVEIVAIFILWAYVRKKEEERPFELYSDSTSKIAYLCKILFLYSFVFILNVASSILNFVVSTSVWTGLINASASLIMLIAMVQVYTRIRALQNEREIFHK
ncbi:DUF2812 domain-containing protein [Viridibacillus sp. YIM B01967]|uniref:DUF2812 domain-containing protein n=1 Tax=Viridibacillus soli TaxID=2798301 RepID=A0ABS1H1Y2_9BACL|nr:DUF2812 domain-containing protein [Viridibacillus soli]MBK3493384.1 DUF2812 domain-containing protein [Viridibacillus soli]